MADIYQPSGLPPHLGLPYSLSPAADDMRHQRYRTLPQEQEQDPSNEDRQGRRRVQLACTRCRKRKTKCSGDPGDGTGCEACKNSGVGTKCTFDRIQQLSKAKLYEELARIYDPPDIFSDRAPSAFNTNITVPTYPSNSPAGVEHQDRGFQPSSTFQYNHPALPPREGTNRDTLGADGISNAAFQLPKIGEANLLIVGSTSRAKHLPSTPAPTPSPLSLTAMHPSLPIETLRDRRLPTPPLTFHPRTNNFGFEGYDPRGLISTEPGSYARTGHTSRSFDRSTLSIANDVSLPRLQSDASTQSTNPRGGHSAVLPGYATMTSAALPKFTEDGSERPRPTSVLLHRPLQAGDPQDTSVERSFADANPSSSPIAKDSYQAPKATEGRPAAAAQTFTRSRTLSYISQKAGTSVNPASSSALQATPTDTSYPPHQQSLPAPSGYFDALKYPPRGESTTWAPEGTGSGQQQHNKSWSDSGDTASNKNEQAVAGQSDSSATTHRMSLSKLNAPLDK